MSTEEIEAKTHAKLGPSGAHRWSRCPGSVVLEEPFPDDASVYSAWGTVAHEIAAMCLWDDVLEEPYAEPQNAESYLGRKFSADGFEFEVDMEMADCVNDYTAQVHAAIDLKAGDKLFVEQEVPIDHITGEKGATGTSDVIGITENGRELVVMDLKGGQGVLVCAEDNEQLALYAMGAIRLHPGVYESVRMIIVQPRKHHVDEWLLTIEELGGIEDELIKAAAAVLGAQRNGVEGYLTPGEKQCQWCKAKAVCPALRNEIVDTITTGADVFDDLDEPGDLPKTLSRDITPVGTLTPEELAAAMRSTKLIEGWVTAVRAEVERRLFAEEEVPGYGLFIGRAGARKWEDEEEAEGAMKAARVKQDDMYTKKLISPTQAEKTIGKDKPRVWKKLEELITQSEGRATVDKLDCGKQPYTAHKAEAEDFDDLGEEKGDIDDLLG